MFYLESDFESFISLIFALTPLSEGSVQHGQRLACPHGFSPRVVLTRPPPLRDSVAGRKCSMPSASHSPGGCRPPVGVVPRWLLVRGCRMRTLTCSVVKERRKSERSTAHSFFCLLFGARKRTDDLSLHPLGIGRAVLTKLFEKFFKFINSVRNSLLGYMQFDGCFRLTQPSADENKNLLVLL